MLDEATRSTVKGTNTIALEGYERDPMQRIVDQRVKLAFHPGMIPEDVGNLVADIGAEKGDARLAIEVLAAAGTNADDRGEELVTAEDVRVAKAAKMSEFPEQKLRELPLHELLVLLSVARRLAKSGDAYATTGPVESTYQVACESANEKPRGHTQFWTYMKNLASYGFLHLQISSAGHAGTTHQPPRRTRVPGARQDRPDRARHARQGRVGPAASRPTIGHRASRCARPCVQRRLRGAPARSGSTAGRPSPVGCRVPV